MHLKNVFDFSSILHFTFYILHFTFMSACGGDGASRMRRTVENSPPVIQTRERGRKEPPLSS